MQAQVVARRGGGRGARKRLLPVRRAAADYSALKLCVIIVTSAAPQSTAGCDDTPLTPTGFAKKRRLARARLAGVLE
jgi:hypothetical protein